MDVKIYTTPTCGYCHQVKRFFHERGISFVEHDVSHDRRAAEEMVQLTGQTGVPVVVLNGEIVIGFDRVRLEQLLAAYGKGNGHRPGLGLRVADGQRFSGHAGAYIGVVEGGSAGERAGLKAGDTIVGIDQTRISSALELENTMREVVRGHMVIVVFIRNDKAMQTRLAM